MRFNLLNKLPRSVKKMAISSLAGMLKNLLRASHEGENLNEDEEDFAILLFQASKHDEDSALYATLVALSGNADVRRHVKTYIVDDLIKVMEEKI